MRYLRLSLILAPILFCVVFITDLYFTNSDNPEIDKPFAHAFNRVIFGDSESNNKFVGWPLLLIAIWLIMYPEEFDE